jgi:hypothetical protein
VTWGVEMAALLFWVIVGAALLFLAPSMVPSRFRNIALINVLRAVGVFIIVLAVLSTSYVHVPDGHLGQLFRVYGGGSLAAGRIVAANGENGPQARIFTPGFHFEPLVNVLYEVDTEQREDNVPDGKVATLVAKDGAALRAGEAFADPFPAKLGFAMLDAEVFLTSGGQRGPQLTVLPPGKYRINHYLWDVALRDAKEIQAGFVGVVKSNVWADVDLGTLRAQKPESCTNVKRPDTPGASDIQRLAAPLVPVGCTGVWVKSLPPGKYYFNPDAFTVTDIDTRAQVWTYAGGYKRAAISLTVDSKGEIQQTRTEQDIPESRENADRAIAVKMEGWDIPLELRAIAQVSPDDAPCVVAGVGTLKQVEDRVLTPSIRAITRDVAGGTYEVTEPKVDENGKPVLDQDGKPIIITVNRPTKALDLINQRPRIEGEIERRIRPEGAKSCVTIREVRLGEPAIPPELLVAVRREQLATQLAKAFIQERAAQEKRIDSENAKATADQQATLVRAVIGVQTSEKDALALKNQGDGQRDQLKAIAEGQRAQMDVLGVEATVRLRQYELLVDKVFGFANAHPEVLTAALTNAAKFVPNIQVGSEGSGMTGLLTALLGQSLAHAQAVPASAGMPAGQASGTGPQR